MAVEGHARVTRIFFNAFQNTTRQNFSETTFTQFRAFGIVIFVQLEKKKKLNQTHQPMMNNDIVYEMSIRHPSPKYENGF